MWLCQLTTGTGLSRPAAAAGSLTLLLRKQQGHQPPPAPAGTSRNFPPQAQAPSSSPSHAMMVSSHRILTDLSSSDQIR